MKTTNLITAFLTAGLIVSCSSDDSNGGSNNNASVSDARVTQVVNTYSGGFNYNTVIGYDSEDRDDIWDYSPLQIYREEAEPVYANGNPKFTFTVNLNPQGLVAEVYTKNIGNGYARYLTYDAQQRVITEEIHDQYLSYDTGSPNTNLALYETITYTWDDDNNLTSIKRQNANADHYSLVTFSDFLEEVKNTLKPANFGFDFYGPYGYPAAEVNGGGNGGYYMREAWAGQYLPAQRTDAYFYTANNEPYNAPVYNYSYTYQKDDDNRVAEIMQEVEDGSFWYKVRISY